ncbi:unnamed protein product [Paramecium sonneborni]|uniref:Transmembrane protein n=1 Tax=Paramecium sonneborni TaxID=65129 RepID=A0A8S1RTS5_9CILI|nr:unnamed protein product [Paramecium sonneborni]
MLKPHQVLLHEFTELILNQRVEQKPSSLRHSNIKGIWVHENQELRLQKKWNIKILIEVWVLEVIITSKQFKMIDQEFKKTQRLALIKEYFRNIGKSSTFLRNPILQQEHEDAYNIQNGSILSHFQTINCSSKNVAYLYIQVHYQKEIIFSPQPRIAQKPIIQREKFKIAFIKKLKLLLKLQRLLNTLIQQIKPQNAIYLYIQIYQQLNDLRSHLQYSKMFFIQACILFGQPDKLTKGFDPDGIACGADFGSREYPYIYFSNPTPTTLHQSLYVKSCPKPDHKNGMHNKINFLNHFTFLYKGNICMPRNLAYYLAIKEKANPPARLTNTSDIYQNKWRLLIFIFLAGISSKLLLTQLKANTQYRVWALNLGLFIFVASLGVIFASQMRDAIANSSDTSSISSFQVDEEYILKMTNISDPSKLAILSFIYYYTNLLWRVFFIQQL